MNILIPFQKWDDHLKQGSSKNQNGFWSKQLSKTASKWGWHFTCDSVLTPFFFLEWTTLFGKSQRSCQIVEDYREMQSALLQDLENHFFKRVYYVAHCTAPLLLLVGQHILLLITLFSFNYSLHCT